MLFLLLMSVLNVALQILTYYRVPSSDSRFDYRALAVISGSLWLLIAVWCVVQIWRTVPAEAL